MPDPHIRVIFADGSFLNFQKPPGFSLPQFMHGARSLGMILTDQFYVPLTMVKAVLDMSFGDEVQIGTNAPSTETRQ
jgi:hypothetical protein